MASVTPRAARLLFLFLFNTILIASALPIDVGKQEEAGPAKTPGCYRFGDLAQHIIPLEYGSLIPVLQSTFENPNVEPLETVNARRLLLKVRDYVDVYAPAYPVEPGPEEENMKVTDTEFVERGTGSIAVNITVDVTVHQKGDKKQSQDLFAEIRSGLDSGYELIGTFKDLGEDHIKDKKVEDKLRSECKNWYDSFMQKAEANDYASFLANPDNMAFHKHTKWSKFFWKANLAMFPTPGMSGIAVLERLLRIQLDEILKRETKVLSMKSILDFDAHEDYHDFRKWIRAIFREDEMFGEVVFGAGAKADLKLLESIYHKFGKLNDKWNKWWFYHKHADKRETAMAAEVSAGWKKLQREVKKVDLPAAIRRIQAELIPPCAL